MKRLLWSAMLITALGSWSMGRVQAQESASLFDVKAPQFEKFVMITEDGVPLFKQADERSPRLLAWNENVESDMADIQYRWDDEPKPGAEYIANPEQMFTFSLLPVLGEEGDFYKVGIFNNWRPIEAAYVPKSVASDIATGPITDEILAKQNYRTCTMVNAGPQKGLIVMTAFTELDEEVVKVGQLMGDCLVVPDHPEIYCSFSPENKDIRVVVDDTSNNCTVFYGPAQSYEESGEFDVRVLDVKKLTAQHIETIYKWAKSSPAPQTEAYYYFPTYHAFESLYQLQMFMYK